MGAASSTTRIPVTDERVLRIVEEGLCPLYQHFGSVNAISERLKESLEAMGKDKRGIFPTRLHALLSMDSGKSVNEETLRNISMALEGVNFDELSMEPLQEEKNSEIEKNLIALWHRSPKDSAALKSIAGELHIPPGFAFAILKNAYLIDSKEDLDGVRRLIEEPGRLHEVSKEPDWSFQDVAVRNCLQKITNGQDPRLGVIVPTGGGKTCIAERIAMNLLQLDKSGVGRVYWISPRKNLKSQAQRDLQDMIDRGVEGIPRDALRRLAPRIEFLMLSALDDIELIKAKNPLLIILDEAHHAAAPSYDKLFDSERFCPILSLTATPNRPDGKSIRIDEVAYSITYKELVERNVILMPKFLDFPVRDFSWMDDEVARFSEYLVEKSKTDFRKIMVIAPTIEKIHVFYEALKKSLNVARDHILTESDIGYVHSRGASGGGDQEAFIKNFKDNKRGILISAQMLLEGFNDPSIDTVILTYPSSSIIVKLQAAGRCVRTNPGKNNAYVVQARNDSLAYYFDQKWLYEDISDYLRPVVEEIEYDSLSDLSEKVEAQLKEHNVNSKIVDRIISQVKELDGAEDFSVMLSGIPYLSEAHDFEKRAEWSAVGVPPDGRFKFIEMFNNFCMWGADISDPQLFIRSYADGLSDRNLDDPSNDWRILNDMFTAMVEAKNELYRGGNKKYDGKNRPFREGCATTWLKYLKFKSSLDVPHSLEEFFRPCFNNSELIERYTREPDEFSSAIRLHIPGGGMEGFLLYPVQEESFNKNISYLQRVLRATEPEQRFSRFSHEMETLTFIDLPIRIQKRIETYLDDDYLKVNKLTFDRIEEEK